MIMPPCNRNSDPNRRASFRSARSCSYSCTDSHSSVQLGHTNGFPRKMSSGRRRAGFERSLSVVQRQFSWREPVRPFVSSTFRDFQAERDLLVKCVFPKLEQLCRLRGTYFAPVDLRWGITSKQASSGDVVRLCLDFVARSAPYFIGLLGDRYGSHIPPSDDADECSASSHCSDEADDWLKQSLAVAQRSGYEWIGDERYKNCSITELEIELAAFRFREKFSCVRFYFRNREMPAEEGLIYGETAFAVNALRRLKERIVGANLPVSEFSTPAELADLVADDWRAIIDEVYPPLFDTLASSAARAGGEEVETSGAQHQLFAEWAAHEAFAETRRRAFVATPQVVGVVRKLHSFILSDVSQADGQAENNDGSSGAHRSRIAVVVGERGSGKSALLANWCRELHEDDPEVRVVAHYVGSSSNSDTPLGFMLHCIDELRASFLDVATSSKAEKREDRSDIMLVRAAFKASLGLGQCIVVLDGLDEMALESTCDKHEVLEWLPFPLPKECHLIVSTSVSHVSFQALQLRSDVNILQLALLDDAGARRLLVERHLAVHCKQLDPEQMERVVESPLAARPVFLASLANELRIFGIHEHVGDRLDYYLAAKSIGDLWGRILRRWSQDYGWDMEGHSVKNDSSQKRLQGWVADALRLLAVSRQGLKEDEMLSTLQDIGYNLSTLDWASFRSATGDALFERQGGLLNFLHQPLRNAVLEHLLDVANADKRSVAELNRYSPEFKQKATWHGRLADILEAWLPSLRRTEELPWQRHMAGDMDGLLRCVSEPAIFLELADRNDQRSHGMLTLDLWNYWHRLTAAGHDQAAVYEEMLSAERKNLGDSPRKGEQPINIDQHAHFALLAGAVGQLHASNGRFLLSQKALSDALFEAEMVVKGSIDSSASVHTSDSHHSCSKKLSLHHARSGFELLSTIQEQLANLCLYQLKVGDAEAWYRAALANASLDDNRDDVSLGDSAVMERRGRLLDGLGYLKAKDSGPRASDSRREAVQLLTEASEYMVAAGSTPGQADVAFHLAVVRARQGYFSEAEDGLRKALRARRGWYGVDHPMVAEVMNELAGLLSNPRRRLTSASLEEAEKLYRRALEVRQQTLGDDHLLVATTLFHLGKLLKSSKDQAHLEEAKFVLQRSMDIRTKHLGVEHGITRAVSRCLGELAAQLGGRERVPSSSHRQSVSDVSTREDHLGKRGRDGCRERSRHSSDKRRERSRHYSGDGNHGDRGSRPQSSKQQAGDWHDHDQRYTRWHSSTNSNQPDQSHQHYSHKRSSDGNPWLEKVSKTGEDGSDDEWQTVKRRRGQSESRALHGSATPGKRSHGERSRRS